VSNAEHIGFAKEWNLS